MAAASLVALPMLGSPTNERFPKKFPNDENGYHGLLFSQVGYNLRDPKRVIIRRSEKNLSGDCICTLRPISNQDKYTSKFKYWGKVWNSHWWIADFEAITKPGEWDIVVQSDDGSILYDEKGFKVDSEILWNETYEWSSVDMLERRRHFTKVGAGWQDAGALWVESPAQSAMIICLTDLAKSEHPTLNGDFKNRIYEQITVGADYLVMTQEKAHELGYEQGAMSHDLLGHEHFILPMMW